MWLIAGLGNPGAQYEITRHNVGFMAADALAAKYAGANFQNAFSGLLTKITLGESPVVILKPQTFMNRSGASVQAAAAFYKIPPENIIVIHDELDLPFGAIRVKQGGGNGGHNGLKDISRLLGPDFIRVRLGIGRPAFKGAEADYVLAPYRRDEMETVGEQISQSCNAVETIIKDGLEEAQQSFNKKA